MPSPQPAAGASPLIDPTKRQPFRKQLRTPEDADAEGLFKAPDRDSVWRQVIFKPVYDPFDIVQSSFEVRAKNAQVVPFNPFRTQRLINSNIGLKNVTVKPRQVGSSTYWLAVFTANAITCPNINTMIVTHRDDTTATMRSTIQNFIAWLNEHKKWNLEIGRDNENELEIKSLGSSFFFQTAGGKGVGRSRTIQQLLASELAHWDSPDPGKDLGGITESMPDNAIVSVESTPNGADGAFYELYNEPNGYTKHFYPWFIEPSRRIPLHGHQLTLTDEEAMLAQMYRLHHEQIAWRRQKIKDLRALKLDFAQEYPEDDITCWTAGTMPYFPPQRMNVLLRQAQATPFASEGAAQGWGGESYEPGGELRIWENPKDGFHYLIGADVGGGHRDGDQSVAHVRCQETGQQVACLSGWWIPQNFGDMCIRLAERYNHAYLGIEANAIGAGAVDHVAHVRKYNNMHWEPRQRQIPGAPPGHTEEEWAPGFYIRANDRTNLVNMVLDKVISGQWRSYDMSLARQMTAARIVRGKTAGGWSDRIEIPKSVHDDHLFAEAQVEALSRVVHMTDTRREASVQMA